MKIIPLTEARSRLSHYGRLCQQEPVIITINSVPAFHLAPLEEDDDLVNQLLAEHSQFRALLEARSQEGTVAPQEALDGL